MQKISNFKPKIYKGNVRYLYNWKILKLTYKIYLFSI